MSTEADIRYIQGDGPKQSALFEQLAEECAELGHAALKYARCLRGENPTPVDNTEALGMVYEEYSDVVLAARVLRLMPREDIISRKAARWAERIAERREAK